MSPPRRILGLSAFFHDSAAALVVDGSIVAAAQEERFSRVKMDARFPRGAVHACLTEAGLTPDDLDLVVFYDHPWLSLERLADTWLRHAPAGRALFEAAAPTWLRTKLDVPAQIRRHLHTQAPIRCATHHRAHAASAFFPSPFPRATIVTVDGVGEWATASWGFGDGNRLTLHEAMSFPDSIGLFYSAITHFLGFRVDIDEYKVMGLAPYGRPRFVDALRTHVIAVQDDGSVRLDLDALRFCTDTAMTGDTLARRLGVPRRTPGAPLTEVHMDLAASAQCITEDAVQRIVRRAVGATGCRDLCLAGGVALNCVSNGKLLRDGIVDRLWIQPAAGDAGGALGAALWGWFELGGAPRTADGVHDHQRGSQLGPAIVPEAAERIFASVGAVAHRLEPDALVATVADRLAAGAAVGWVQGRAEYGPRALGNRSILADPRGRHMQSHLNQRIKARESFRPFAPAVRQADAGAWFELRGDSDYMLLTAPVAPSRRLQLTPEDDARTGFDRLAVPRSQVPAVTHVDDSARLQTVHPGTNPRFAALLDAFAARTGVPLLVNTSFNGADEPIVQSAQDAWRSFRTCRLDVLVVGDLLLDAAEQPPIAPRPGPGPHTHICILGESTAMGAPYDPHLDLGSLVALLFDGHLDGRDITVENLARPGVSAEAVVRDQLPRVPAHTSLVIVYSGHNEDLGWSRSRSRLWGRPHAERGAHFGRLDRTTRLRRSTERYAAALDTITTTLRARGIRVVGVVPAANRCAFAPNLSVYPDRDTWRRVQAALTAAPDLPSLARLAAAHPDVAIVQFRLGEVEPEPQRARAHFDRALALDASGLRAPDAIRDAAARVYGTDAVDAEAALSARDPLPGARWFADYCHPTLEGYLVIAEAIAAHLVARGHVGTVRPRSPAEVRAALLLDAARISYAATRSLGVLSMDMEAWHNPSARTLAEAARARVTDWTAADPALEVHAVLRALYDGDDSAAVAHLAAARRRDPDATHRRLALLFPDTDADAIARLSAPVVVQQLRRPTALRVALGLVRARIGRSGLGARLRRLATRAAFTGIVVPLGQILRLRPLQRGWAPYVDAPPDTDTGALGRFRLVAFLLRRHPVRGLAVATLLLWAWALTTEPIPALAFLYALF